MNISYRNKYTFQGARISRNFVNYFEDSLADSNYYGGELERAAGRAENNSKAIGRLVEILTEKKILNVEDIMKIAETEHSHEDVLLEKI